MKESAIVVCITAVLASCLFLRVVACMPAATPEITKSTAYGTELAKCREDAGVWQDYQLCKEAAQKRFGVQP